MERRVKKIKKNAFRFKDISWKISIQIQFIVDLRCKYMRFIYLIGEFYKIFMSLIYNRSDLNKKNFMW